MSELPDLTWQEFKKKVKPIQLEPAVLEDLWLNPKEFRTTSVGWAGSTSAEIPGPDRIFKVQIFVNATVVGSKRSPSAGPPTPPYLPPVINEDPPSARPR